MKAYCVDIGSEKRENFAWATSHENNGTHLKELLENLILDVGRNEVISIGFECPLYFEIQKEPGEVTKSREFDGNRSWSAGAGAQATITGMAQITWLFKELKEVSPRTECKLLNDWKEHAPHIP